MCVDMKRNSGNFCFGLIQAINGKNIQRLKMSQTIKHINNNNISNNTIIVK